MKDHEILKDRLETCLKGFLERPEIKILGDKFYKLQAVIISPTFEGLNEAERQEIVWDRVLKTFEVEDWRNIDFIYTNAPSEYQTA